MDSTARSGLPFTPIAPVAVTVDDVTVPRGLRLGRRSSAGATRSCEGAPAFDPRDQSPEAQAGQFGYNNDYLDIIETNRSGTRALLVCNHEYTNEGIMFPPGHRPAEQLIRTAGRRTACRSSS